MRIAVTLLVVLAACGKGPSEPPAVGSGSGSAPPQALRAIAKLRSPKLIAGSRAIAIAEAGDGWLVPAPGMPRSESAIGTQIAKARASLGGDFEIFLGARPLVVGGEEHHEQHIRIDATPDSRSVIEFDGHLVRVAALRSGDEVWQFEERLRPSLAVVDAAGKVTVLPAFELIGKPVPQISPVSTKKCATPQIRELASTGEVIAALLVECNPEAPVRIVTYRFPGPVATVQQVSMTELGFDPTHLVISPNGSRALVGVGNGKLVIARLASDGKPTPQASLANVTLVAEAAIADDGAIWALTISSGDSWQVTRDGVPAVIVDPSGKILRPSQLAYDTTYGIVVLADNWLLVER